MLGDPRRSREGLNLRDGHFAHGEFLVQGAVPVEDALDRLVEAHSRTPAKALTGAGRVEVEMARLMAMGAAVQRPAQAARPSGDEALQERTHRAGVRVGWTGSTPRRGPASPQDCVSSRYRPTD